MDCLLAKKDQEIRDLKEKLEKTLAEISISSPNQGDNESTDSPFDYVEKFESRKIEIQRDANGYFPCDQCEYKSYVNIDIDSHYTRTGRTRTGEEPFRCRICKQRFKSKTSCIRHIRGHDNRSGLPKSNLAKKEQQIREEKLEQALVEIRIKFCTKYPRPMQAYDYKRTK